MYITVLYHNLTNQLYDMYVTCTNCMHNIYYVYSYYQVYYSLIILQLTMTFDDNEAYIGGAALYVNDVSPCGYAPSPQDQTNGDTAPSFNRSLLVLPQFTYR